MWIFICFICFQIRRFRILVFNHEANASSQFVFYKGVGLSGMDVKATHIFFTLTATNAQLVNKGLPWRGGQEKNYESMQLTLLQCHLHP